MHTITLQTIADLVHVSRSTVSRVLNSKWKENGISEATAKVIITKARCSVSDHCGTKCVEN